jgi:hypothetical protein
MLVVGTWIGVKLVYSVITGIRRLSGSLFVVSRINFTLYTLLLFKNKPMDRIKSDIKFLEYHKSEAELMINFFNDRLNDVIEEDIKQVIRIRKNIIVNKLLEIDKELKYKLEIIMKG